MPGVPRARPQNPGSGSSATPTTSTVHPPFTPHHPTKRPNTSGGQRAHPITPRAAVHGYTAAGDAAGEQQTVLTMHRAGVTTILPLVNVNFLQEMMGQATAEGYYPEWLATNYLANDYDDAVEGLPKDQSAHLFGLMS